ncbi:MAG TPA: amidohydrolase family protein [Chloroflexota bacterium]|nr:amidohydrolase family protein [Chloroflexota bacterium]
MRNLLIRAGTVFTAAAEPVVRDAWLSVEGDRIAEVSPSEPRARGGATRIDAPCATLLPGLIDCHVHFALTGGADWLADVRTSYALACWRAAAFARATLRAGFTTVRTLGGRDGMDTALRDAQAAGVVEAPRVVAANLAICMTGGHGAWIGREADGPDEVRKAVREQLKAGADCIKLIATGGVMTPGVEVGAQQLTDDELRAGVEEAHRAGRKVASHAHAATGIRAAVLAGVDSIEHGSFLADDTIGLMKERGTFLSMTLSSAAGIADAPPNTVPDWARAKAAETGGAMVDSFRRAHHAGVRLVLGTDAGTPYNVHGANARELALMVKYGLDPLEGLRSASLNGAELLGLSDQVGSLEPGKQADLVLCEGDVLADVTQLCNPENLRLVVQSGNIVHQRAPVQEV